VGDINSVALSSFEDRLALKGVNGLLVEFEFDSFDSDF
jgi:hypothetical protein